MNEVVHAFFWVVGLVVGVLGVAFVLGAPIAGWAFARRKMPGPGPGVWVAIRRTWYPAFGCALPLLAMMVVIMVLMAVTNTPYTYR